MATITERFGFTKPAGSDPASIVPLNSNTDLIEQYLGRTQDMIAPMYDDTATYDVGDIVTYESNLYKCITAISTAETFDPTKWERTTASESGGGGSAELDILGEASGAVASFSDGASAGLAKCIAEINPTQDLHGYDKPWAGGAGKNKLDISSVTTSTSANWGVTISNDELTIEHKNTYSTGVPKTADIELTAGTYCVSYNATSVIVLDLYVNGSWLKSIKNGGTFTLSASSSGITSAKLP